jgi:hypothetical protein
MSHILLGSYVFFLILAINVTISLPVRDAILVYTGGSILCLSQRKDEFSYKFATRVSKTLPEGSTTIKADLHVV